MLRITPLNSLILKILLILGLTSCGSLKPYISKDYQDWQQRKTPDELMHSVYLVGDAGEPVLENTDPVLAMLSNHIRQQSATENYPRFHADIGRSEKIYSPQSQSVIYLGDNIYEYGMPPATDEHRPQMEAKIIAQIDAVDTTASNLFFIPGNHDWNNSRPGGLAAVIRQQEFIETYLNNNRIFFPKNGCAGPVDVEISDQLTMIFIDSEWWLTKERRPEAPENGCETESEFDFLVQLEDMIDKHEDKHIVLAMHHPLFSNSNHGGHFSFMDNLFPLRLVNPDLMIPLPVIGSLYPLLRKNGVSRQDIPHFKYQELKKSIIEILDERPNVIVAAGHDHNLQLKNHKKSTFIVSGAASKLNFVARGRKMDFTHQTKGFAKVNYYRNGEAWVEFWYPHQDHPLGQMSFRTPLYTLPSQMEDTPPKQSATNYQDSTTYLAAGPEYSAGAFKKFWLGKHYRDVWTTPVQLNYLDIDKEAGGLFPLKKGGGKQTVSLRLMNNKEIQYNLRSINKDPKGALPQPLHGTIFESLVSDQISTAHPYGAFVIPPMAKALDLYHTNPSLYYVPDDPSLGRFRQDFAGMMALLEIRPDEDLTDFERFGFSKEVVSTNTMKQKIREDNDDSVDQPMFLRARIFDMIIGDWDRHQDQWRWAEFDKPHKGSLYRPVPRDRDQVFTKFDGLIPWLASRRWAQRNLTHFGYGFKDVVGLNLSATALDRQFLNGLSWDQWEEIAADIKQGLTDEVIDKAVKEMPEEVYALSAEEIADKLKSRKRKLLPALRKYYLALSKEVDITGSEKHEFFRIERLSNGYTKVSMFKTEKDGDVEKQLYARTFHAKETKEIRIYTLGGKDSVRITGKVPAGAIKLRIVGGNDANTVIDESSGGPVLVYDYEMEENQVVKGKNTRVKSKDKEYINEYDPREYYYPYVGPRVAIEANADDGLYLGGGIYWNTYGFRKDPYKSEHLLTIKAATATNAVDFQYQATHYSLFGRNWDLQLQGHFFGPKYVFNYFGTGNGTVQEINDIDFYRIRMDRINAEASVNYRFSDVFKIGAGPTWSHYDPKSRPENITSSPQFDAPEDLTSAYFLGTKAFLHFNLVDFDPYPRRGLRWYNEWTYQQEMGGSDTFHRLSSDLSFYVTPNLPLSITLAMRFGVAANFGDYKFYQSNFLGQDVNLRGYRRTRFAGKTAAYQNTEVRIGLSSIRSYLFTGYWGILGFIDHGRVWTDDEGINSSSWKRGYGPGVWINVFKYASVSLEYGISNEDRLFTLNFGLQF